MMNTLMEAACRTKAFISACDSRGREFLLGREGKGQQGVQKGGLPSHPHKGSREKGRGAGAQEVGPGTRPPEGSITSPNSTSH